MASGVTPHVSRFTVHGSRFTVHEQRVAGVSRAGRYCSLGPAVVRCGPCTGDARRTFSLRQAHMSGRTEVRHVPKPWGHETIWASNDLYVGKILHITAGQALSIQYHNVKDETVYLLRG